MNNAYRCNNANICVNASKGNLVFDIFACTYIAERQMRNRRIQEHLLFRYIYRYIILLYIYIEKQAWEVKIVFINMKKGYDIIFHAWPGFKLETSGLFLNASSKCVHIFLRK